MGMHFGKDGAGKTVTMLWFRAQVMVSWGAFSSDWELIDISTSIIHHRQFVNTHQMVSKLQRPQGHDEDEEDQIQRYRRLGRPGR